MQPPGGFALSPSGGEPIRKPHMSFQSRQGVPLKPDYSARPRPGVFLERAIVATVAVGMGKTVSAQEYARKRWDDGNTEMVLRGTAAPALTSVTGWASQFARDIVGDFVASLA